MTDNPEAMPFVEVERIHNSKVVSTELWCLSCVRMQLHPFSDYWTNILLTEGSLHWVIPASAHANEARYQLNVVIPKAEDDLVCNLCKRKATSYDSLSPWDQRGTLKADEFYSVSCRATFEVEVSGGVALATIEWPTFILSVRALGITNANHAENIAKAMMYSAINLNGRRSVPNLMLHIVATKI